MFVGCPHSTAAPRLTPGRDPPTFVTTRGGVSGTSHAPFRSLSPAAPGHRHRAPMRCSGGQEARILADLSNGAQRASSRRPIRVTALTLVVALIAAFGAVANPSPAEAATIKVVIVVGPSGSNTGKYIYRARKYAAQARGYGARVIEIYSPNATWSKVKAAAQGANLLVYLGHGNGYPSPYGSFQKYTKDGLGLNRVAGNGNYNVKYWGEYYIDRDIQMAKNAVVILNRLCYASGNSEWGSPNPTRSTAVKRVDNYGAGFLRAGAKAVFAEAIESAAYTIKALFVSNRTMDSILMAHPEASGARDFKFSSVRTTGYRAHLDPPKAGKYWRSVIGNLSMRASTWRLGG